MKGIQIPLLVVTMYVLAINAYALLPSGKFYKNLQTAIDNGSTVKSALNNTIKNNKVFSYKKAREYLFGSLHLEKDQDGSYIVTDVYCQNTHGKSIGVAPGRIPNSNVINCEHTWPQSKFNKSESTSAQKSDLHHLFPVDSRSNSSRGNIMFAEVNGRDVHENCSASQRGQDIYSQQTAFQPPLEHRGNVARAMFYFSIRYNISIPDREEKHLREWHLQDPVDAMEIKRNEEIFKLQNNRNPFIDEPSVVDEISNF